MRGLIKGIFNLIAVTFVFTASPCSLVAQQNQHPDTSLVKKFIDSGTSFLGKGSVGSLDTARIYYDSALRVSLVTKYEKWLPTIYLRWGVTYFYEKNYDSTVVYSNRCIEIASALKDTVTLMKAYGNIGGAYFSLKNYDKYVFCTQKSIALAEGARNYDQMINGYINMARYFQDINQPDKLKKYVSDAIACLPKSKSPQALERVYALASEYYTKLAQTDPKYIDSCKTYVNGGFELSKKNDFIQRVYFYEVLQANYLYRGGKLNESKNKFEEALSHKEFLNETSLGNAHLVAAEVYAALNNKAKALKHLDSITTIKEWEEGDARIAFLKEAYVINNKFGNNEEAIALLEELRTREKNMLNKEINETLLDLETKYQTAKKDAEIEKRKQQKAIDDISLKKQQLKITWLIIAVVAVVLFIVFMYLFYRQRMVKDEIEILLAEQRLNRARINPHFLNNAFTTIQSMAFSSDDTEQLVNFTSGVARFSRLMLESSINDEWTVKSEIELCVNYIAIYQKRYGNKWDITVQNQVADELAEKVIVPSALIQPLIENAFEHSQSKEKIPVITISIYSDNSCVTFKIINTLGSNELAAKKRKDDEKSRGLEIIINRIALFEKRNKKRIEYSFDKSEKEVVTIIKIPVS